MQVPTGIKSLGNMKLGKERCRRARFSTQQAQGLAVATVCLTRASSASSAAREDATSLLYQHPL